MARDLLTGSVSGNDTDHDLLVKAAKALQSIASVSGAANIGRASLSSNVTRISDDSIDNTGLSALDVAVEASAHYLIKYRLWTTQSGSGGWQFGHEWPASPDQLSGTFVANGLNNGAQYNGFGSSNFVATQDYPTLAAASGDAAILTSVGGGGSVGTSGDYHLIEFTFDLYNGANAGTFKLLFAQEASVADATTLMKNSSVEWTKL
jgi:hypothetical protein